MDTITFKGITYARSDLSAELIILIETYNANQGAVSAKLPTDTDYKFRLNQALQIFGDPVVVLSIEILITKELNNN